MKILLIVFIVILTFQLFLFFKFKNVNYCENILNLFNISTNPTIKYNYYSFNKISLINKINPILNSNHKKMYFENYFYKHKEYLFTLSKFIEYKIQNCKLKFRTKNNYLIIENIAYLLAKEIYKSNPYQIFKNYKIYMLKFSIKQKENKYFKFLLAQYLILELINIQNELITISKIILKYKKRKIFDFYNKNIYKYAKYYSIFKYNNNSFKYEYSLNLDKTLIIKKFIQELFDAEYKEKIIITYLKTMF